MSRVSVVGDVSTVEICGALKNIVACAAGFCDGLKMGDNTKAATIRLGLREMMKYGETFYPGGDRLHTLHSWTQVNNHLFFTGTPSLSLAAWRTW